MIDLGDFVTEITLLFTVSMFAFVVAMAITPVFTFLAYKHGWWKKKRTTATTGEKLSIVSALSTRKRKVPTMAGIIPLFAVTITTVAFNLDRQQTWLPLAGLIGGGLVGLIDDIINIRGNGEGVAGLRAPIKFGMITAVAAVASWFFYAKLGYTTILLPFVGDFSLGWLIIPLFIIAVVSTSNAVNISDGLDGLAGGLLLNAYAAFGTIAAFQGNFGIATFCMTIAGTLLAYLWFNIPPARFFMGDVGSFSLGTALGVVAMLTDTLFLLPIIGFVFVLEAGTSLLQIMSKKFFKRKIFIAAPIHHHFEAQGWEKTKVTMRFWVISQACAILGIIIALVGNY
jgi:phospho-N-acetylmuramoyl-pentapeptide-transferase